MRPIYRSSSKVALCFVVLTAGGCGGARDLSAVDIVGDYCGRSHSRAEGREVAYKLSLTADQHYRVSLSTPSASVQGSSQSGRYRIYGEGPVDRVELQGVCLQTSSCGDYPAQVEAWGQEAPELTVEDLDGQPLTLARCD